ncbi:MAG: WD40/YVTN/BNR-like repeat-containing protein [Solirubrobacteraceae bacterium]
MAVEPGALERCTDTKVLAFGAGFLVVAAVVGVLLSLHGSPPPHKRLHPSSSHHAVHHPPRTSKPPSQPQPSHTKTSPSTSSTGSTPPGGPVPANFAPQSFTAISELTWWMLGSAPCSHPTCTSIVRTSDGGRTFAGIPAPVAPLATGPQSGTPGVSELRFADSHDGFAYGPSLFVTHNAGQSWEQVNLGAAVTNIAISSTDVYALVASSGGAGKLVRSPTGASNWVPLSVSVSAYGGLSVHGSDVFAQSGPKLLVSHDGGGTFSSYPAPSDLPCDFEEPVPPVVWAHCATGTESSTWRSSDGGRRFTAPGPGSGEAGIAPEPNSAVFAAASDTTAVLGYQQLYRTTDGGATYSPVAPGGFTWRYLGFTDSTHGVALGYPAGGSPIGRLFYTAHGGASYHLVPIH